MNVVDELRIHAETLANIVDRERKFFSGVEVYARKLHQLAQSQPSNDPRPELTLHATKIEEFVARYRPSPTLMSGVFYLQPAHARAADDALSEIRKQLAAIANLPVSTVLALFRGKDEAEARNASAGSDEVDAMPTTKAVAAPSVFISHSHADKEIADALVELLAVAFALRANQIRCTSRLANALTTGTDADSLRSELNSAWIVIGLVSDLSVQSAWVLFELGARWFQGQTVMPVLVAGALAAQLPKPIRDLASVSASDPDQVQKLVEDVGDVLGIEVESPLHYKGRLKDLVQKSLQAASDRSEQTPDRLRLSSADEFAELVHFHFDYSAFIAEDPQGTGRINLSVTPFAVIHSPLTFSIVEYALLENEKGQELVRSKRIVGPRQLVPRKKHGVSGEI